jgi:small neutral amino acid transporter SnatA (MarC family)
MLQDFFSSSLATLLVTLDPPGLAPIFISLTQGMDVGQRRQVALRACLIAFATRARRLAALHSSVFNRSATNANRASSTLAKAKRKWPS